MLSGEVALFYTYLGSIPTQQALFGCITNNTGRPLSTYSVRLRHTVAKRELSDRRSYQRTKSETLTLPLPRLC